MTSAYPITKTKTKRQLLRGFRKTEYKTPAGGSPSDTPFFSTIVSTDEVKLGASPQPFRDHLANGKSTTSFLNGITTKFSYSGVNGSQVIYPGTPFEGIHTWSGFLSSGTIIVSVPGTEAVVSSKTTSRAIQGLTSSYNKTVQSWDGGSFIAEISGLRNLLSGGLGAMAGLTLGSVKQLDKLRRQYSRRGPGACADALANLYLEWTFGIAPLASDVVNLSNAIGVAVLAKKGPQMIRVHGSARDSTQPTMEVRDLTSIPASQMVRTWSEESIKYTAGVIPMADPLGLRRFGLFGDNGLTAIWNGTPFSFLLDYVTNAGEIIDATKFWWTEVRWVEEGREQSKIAFGHNAFPKIIPGQRTAEVSGGGWRCTCKRKTRTALPSLPLPQFHFKSMNTRQIANVGALFVALRDLFGLGPPSVSNRKRKGV